MGFRGGARRLPRYRPSDDPQDVGNDPFALQLAVLVVTAPPDASLVAAARSAIQPLIHAPKAIQTARIGRIGMIDNALFQHECADAGPFARVSGGVGSSRGCDLAN